MQVQVWCGAVRGPVQCSRRWLTALLLCTYLGRTPPRPPPPGWLACLRGEDWQQLDWSWTDAKPHCWVHSPNRRFLFARLSLRQSPMPRIRWVEAIFSFCHSFSVRRHMLIHRHRHRHRRRSCQQQSVCVFDTDSTVYYSLHVHKRACAPPL